MYTPSLGLCGYIILGNIEILLHFLNLLALALNFRCQQNLALLFPEASLIQAEIKYSTIWCTLAHGHYAHAHKHSHGDENNSDSSNAERWGICEQDDRVWKFKHLLCVKKVGASTASDHMEI